MRSFLIFILNSLTAKDIAYIGLRDVDPGERFVFLLSTFTTFVLHCQLSQRSNQGQIIIHVLKSLPPLSLAKPDKQKKKKKNTYIKAQTHTNNITKIVSLYIQCVMLLSFDLKLF